MLKYFTRMAISAVAFASGLHTSTASAQSVKKITERGIQTYSEIETSWNAILSPGSTIPFYSTNAFASTSGIANQTAFVVIPLPQECGSHFPQGYAIDISSRFESLGQYTINGSSSVHSDAGAGLGYEPPAPKWSCVGDGIADAFAGATGGSTSTSFQQSFTGASDYEVWVGTPNPVVILCGTVPCAPLGAANANSQTNFTLNGSIETLSVNHSVDSFVRIMPSGIGSGGSIRRGWISYVRASVTGTSTPATSAGLFAILPDETVIRRGIYQLASFDPGYTIDPTTNWKTISVSTATPVTILTEASVSSATPINIEVEEDSFAWFNGNIDNDGINGVALTCHVDRAAIVAIIGSDIDDPEYSPRADFDLDGQVTPADLDLFNELPCSMDFDCDGVVDLADYFWFMDAYDTQSLNADLNADSAVDLVDYFTFLAAYDLPCIQG